MKIKTPANETADRVNAAMKLAKRSKSYVAAEAGIPLTTFSRKLNGHTDFTVSDLARIASILKCAPSDLVPAMFQTAVAA